MTSTWQRLMRLSDIVLCIAFTAVFMAIADWLLSNIHVLNHPVRHSPSSWLLAATDTPCSETNIVPNEKVVAFRYCCREVQQCAVRFVSENLSSKGYHDIPMRLLGTSALMPVLAVPFCNSTWVQQLFNEKMMASV